jgi:glutamate N-acetyltransferase/amino-acid N-acetyltransferase
MSASGEPGTTPAAAARHADPRPGFSSRWTPLPEHCAELPPATLPPGFRAAGVAAGIKPSGGHDVALLVCDSTESTSAARFTRSGTQAAPVLVTRERCRLDALRAVAINSGNANAATGSPGYQEAARMQGAGAMACGVPEDQVAVCSTGVIGVQLDGRAVVKGLAQAAHELRPDGGDDFQAAIETTDLFSKRASLSVELPGGTVTLSGQCKGAGMIQPSFATMLCFVETDAVLPAETADLLLGVCVKRSFDRITVDGQLSTNDTAILIAGGESRVGVEAESDSERLFGEALDTLLRHLALAVVRDGEGASRVARVIVRGGHGPSVERAARAVANSPLVKTALYGGDANWGRIVQAVGMALPDSAPLPLDIAIEGTQVCVAGQALRHDEAALAERLQRAEIEYEIGLPGEGNETEVFFSDLGHEYIRINAEYTT